MRNDLLVTTGRERCESYIVVECPNFLLGKHTDEPVCDEGIQLLRRAILKQAVDDYFKAKNDEETTRSLERFFLSDWGQRISDNMGEAIIRRIREIEKKKKTYIILNT